MDKAKSKARKPNRITVSGIDIQWSPRKGTCTFGRLPVAMMWVDTTLASLMKGVQSMVGTERFVLALQSEGRKSVDADWNVISQHPDFKAGFKAIASAAAVGGWGHWELVSHDDHARQCTFRVTDSWEGLYQKRLGVCWGSAMLSGKFAGYCSRLFDTNCWADQTAFIARGDAYEEFVVSPSSRSIEDEIEGLLATDEATRADMAVALRKLEEEIAERRKAEDALRESEEMFRGIFENAVEGIFLSTPEGRFVSVNTAMAHMCGYGSPEEMVADITDISVQHYVTPSDRDIFMRFMEEQGHVSGWEHQLLRKDGGRIWVSVNAGALRDPQGRIMLYQGTCQDITRRKEAEAALRESEERWKFALEGSGDGVWDWDAATGTVYFSPQWKAMLGFEENEIGNTLHEWDKRVHPDDRDYVYAEINRHFAGHTPVYSSEHRVLCKDGTYKWVLDRGKVISRTEDGKPLRVIGTHTDLTGPKQAENLIRVQRDLGIALSQTSSLDDALDLVLGAALEIEGIDCGGIYLVDARKSELNLVAHSGLSEEFIRAVSRFSFDSPLWMTARQGKALYGKYSDVGTVAGVPLEQENIKTAGIIPVMHEGRVIALFNIASRHDQDFSEGTRSAIESLAARIGGVIPRIRAESALSESRRNLQALFDSIDDMLFILDEKGCILQTNPEVQRRLGYTAQELATMHVLDVHPPDRRQEASDIVADMIGGRAASCPVPLMTKEGGLIPVETKVTPGKWGGRDVLFGITRDISERIRAEELLRMSEERYRQLVENATDVIYETDASGYVRYMNPSAEILAGRSREEYIGRHYFEFLPPEYREQQARMFGIQFVKKIPTRNYETPILTTDGRIVWLWQSVNLIFEGEKVIGFRVIARDVTDRKRAEEELREREQFQQALLKNLSAGVVIIDSATHVIESVNPAARELFGASIDDIVGRTCHSFLCPAQERACPITDLKLEVDNSERLLIRSDGTSIPILKSVKPFTVGGQEKLLEVFFDLTESKRMEAERIELERRLQQAQRLESLGVLAGGIAHDFNNLLMGVLGNLDLSLLDLPQGSRPRTLIEKAMHAGRRAADLTRQMLAYSGKGRYVVGRVNINDLVHQNDGFIRAAIPRTVTLEMDLTSLSTVIEADADQVKQVIMNILTNAAEAIGEHPGTITLRTSVQYCDGKYLRRSRIYEKPPAGRFVTVEVSDTGSGMDEQALTRLFEPFYSTKFTGRGLGMSAVLGIMSTHNGAIFVESTPGKGSAIRVLFPACEVEHFRVDHDSGRATDPAGQDARTGLVLIVDDERDIREVCSVFVEHLGFGAITASDGLEAIELFRKHGSEIVCVLLDLTMPRLDGVGTYQEMAGISKDIPVILSSGFSELDISRRFSTMGLAGFIQKPYTLHELKDKITNVLREFVKK